MTGKPHRHSTSTIANSQSPSEFRTQEKLACKVDQNIDVNETQNESTISGKYNNNRNKTCREGNEMYAAA